MVPFPRRLPHSISLLEEQEFEPSVPRKRRAVTDTLPWLLRTGFRRRGGGPEL